MTKRKHQAPRNLQKSGGGGRDAAVLYGLHPVRAALGNPRREIYRLRATAEALERLRKSLPAEARARLDAVAVTPADRRALDKAAGESAVHQGLVLEAAPLALPTLDSVIERCAEDALVVVLDQVTDPRNVGAVLRSAAVFGASAVITTERNAPAESGVLAKAAAGALEQVPYVAVVNLARALDTLRNAGFWIIGLEGEARATLAEIDLGPRRALVLGAEGAGLRRLTRERCDALARIPTPGLGAGSTLDSLNVSTAAAVGLYELLTRDRSDR